MPSCQAANKCIDYLPNIPAEILPRGEVKYRQFMTYIQQAFGTNLYIITSFRGPKLNVSFNFLIVLPFRVLSNTCNEATYMT